MNPWTGEELDRIGTAEELQIQYRRANGVLSRPVTIWVVRLGDDLYVRSVNGPAGSWFRSAQALHEGRIQAGGVQKDVTLVEEPDPALSDRIDAAYRAKYRRYPGPVGSITSPGARAATIKLVPRPAGE